MATTRSGKKRTKRKKKKKGPAAKTTPRKAATSTVTRDPVAVAPSPPPPPVLQPAGNPVSLDDTPITVSAELGRSRITLDRALQVTNQSLIELDKSVGDPVDIRINGCLYARGEVVTVSESFGVRITELIDSETGI